MAFRPSENEERSDFREGEGYPVRREEDSAAAVAGNQAAAWLTSLPVGVYHTDLDGNCLRVNPAWAEFAGLREEEARGWGWIEALHPGDRDRVVAEWQRAVANRGRFQAEYRFRTRDGGSCWVLARASPVRGLEGGPAGYIGTITDISERKRLEDCLQTTQDMLRRVVINMPVMLAAFGADGTIVAWNKECERITEFRAAEVQKDPEALGRLCPDPSDRERLRADWCDNQADYRNRMITLRTKGGDLRFVSWSNLSHALPIHGWSAWGVGADVTELRRSQETLEQISQNLTERVNELRCLYAVSTVLNRAMPADLSSAVQTVVDLIPSGFRCPDRCCAGITLNGVRIVSASYRQTPWHLQSPIRAARGEQVGVVDVYCSGRSPAPSAGEFLREEQYLLDEIACRIGELVDRRAAREELQDARNRAEAGVKLRDELLGNVSHELRTPMNSILGYTEMLLDGVEGPLSPEQSESLRRVDRNARRLLHLIDELLDLSMMESGRVELVAEEFSIREVVTDLVRDLRGAVHRKGLRMDYRIEADVPDFLIGDQLRLRQIVGNLLDNAVKFTEHGRVACSIGVERREERRVVLHVRVTDTGAGVPPSKHGLIFEPFMQVDGSPTRKRGGSGLGLAICKHLVELMGGLLWLESKVGQGSTFHAILPFDCAEADAEPRQDQSRPRNG